MGRVAEVTFFRDVAELDDWYAANHATQTELWLGLHKKHVAHLGITWDQAVIVALTWGWIDSVGHRIDEDTTRQRFTPRKPGSIWSSVNLAHVERLIAEGRMHPSGLAAYERRRPDRMGVYAFEQETIELTTDQRAAIASSPAAQAFWDAATPGYRKVAIHWMQSAKQETTRQRRLAQLIDDCAHGRLIPSQRYGEAPAWLARAAAAAQEAGL